MFVFTLLASLGSTVGGSLTSAGPTFAAGYYPFQYETVEGIDCESIWLKYDVTSLLTKDHDRIVSTLRNSKGVGEFKPLSVRLGLRLRDGVSIYVDKFGGVLVSGKSKKLTAEEFASLCGELSQSIPPPPPVRWTIRPDG